MLIPNGGKSAISTDNFYQAQILEKWCYSNANASMKEFFLYAKY